MIFPFRSVGSVSPWPASTLRFHHSWWRKFTLVGISIGCIDTVIGGIDEWHLHTLMVIDFPSDLRQTLLPHRFHIDDQITRSMDSASSPAVMVILLSEGTWFRRNIFIIIHLDWHLHLPSMVMVVPVILSSSLTRWRHLLQPLSYRFHLWYGECHWLWYRCSS